jgi:hypothetical protein
VLSIFTGVNTSSHIPGYVLYGERRAVFDRSSMSAASALLIDQHRQYLPLTAFALTKSSAAHVTTNRKFYRGVVQSE